MVSVAVMGLVTAVAPTLAAAEVVALPCPTPTVTSLGVLPFPPTTSEGATGTRIGYAMPAAATHPAVDMDRDGVPDTLTLTDTSGNQTLTIVRGDGTVTITGPFVWSQPPGGWRSADVTGDGRDDLWTTVEPIGLTSLTEPLTFVIPGSLAPGNYSLASVGLQFTGRVVGDVTGDGLDDAYIPSQLAATSLNHPPGRVVPFLGVDWTATPPRLPNYPVIVADRADLDFDGIVDTLYLDSTGGTGGRGQPALHFSFQDVTVPLDPTAQPDDAVLLQSGTRFYVRTTTSTGTGGEVQRAYRLHVACANPWMGSVSAWIFGRNPLPSDFGSLSPGDDPTQAQRTTLVTSLVHSPAARIQVIAAAYTAILNRFVDASGLAYWQGVLVSGHRTREDLAATLLGSNEAYLRFGLTIPSWVERVYGYALGRRADSGGLAYWSAQVDQFGIKQVAARFLASAAARREAVRRTYTLVAAMDSPPTADQLTQGVALLAHGGMDALQIQIASSDAHYLKGQQDHTVGPPVD